VVSTRGGDFLRAGLRAVDKLDAYPFTRYGVLRREVEPVPPDSTVDQQRGLVFPVRVKLVQTRLMVERRPVVLTAGMSAAVEVVTGRRRVIDYLWSPVAKAVGDAGRERWASAVPETENSSQRRLARRIASTPNQMLLCVFGLGHPGGSYCFSSAEAFISISKRSSRQLKQDAGAFLRPIASF
jgi:hypothetical protein